MDWFKVYAKICFLLPMVFTIKYLSWFPVDVPVIQWDHGSPGSFRAKIFKGHRSRWPCRALVGWTVRCQTQIPNWMVRINKSTKILSIRRISNRKICTCDSRCIYTYIHIYLYNWHHHTHIVFFDCRPVMPCLPCVTSVQTGLWTSGRETTLRGGGKCWETFGKINLKQSTFGIHMIHMIHQNPRNHTGITWRIFRA